MSVLVPVPAPVPAPVPETECKPASRNTPSVAAAGSRLLRYKSDCTKRRKIIKRELVNCKSGGQVNYMQTLIAANADTASSKRSTAEGDRPRSTLGEAMLVS